MLRSKGGYSILEYTVVFIIIIAALLSMNIYFKRGLQGRWKDMVDQVGDQYNPGTTSGLVSHRIYSKADTRLQTLLDSSGSVNGYYTMRSDSSASQENKIGSMQVSY